MDQHSLKILEYKRVLEMLAAHCSNSIGQEQALSLTPTAFPEIVRTRLQETAESRALRDFDSGIPLGGIRDIREHVQRAAMGGVLVPLELLDVSSTVAASRRIKQYLFKRKDTAPLLGEIGHNIPQFPLLEGQISEAIAENGILRDNATPELARLRSATKTTAQRLNEKLQSVLTSDKFKTYIQEPIITVRDGRYCIPVKAENRGLFGGMVHDLSQSGATAFVEPAATVELGNDLKELTIKEEQEVYRILTRLSGLVSAVASELGDAIRLLGNLDLMNAKALVAEEMIAVQPIMNHKGIIRIRRARHPLLTPPVVPIEVHLGDRFTTLLITGPNTGGKTVALKTVGLLTLMAQSGLEIPAEPGSELSIFEQVFADIGDEQDIRQSLSTFSAHLKNIVHILRELGKRGLVLLDEVGAGTDPAEGAALARAILEELSKRSARVIATTHYGELKEYAYQHSEVENASVEFDMQTLGPTYRLLMGAPGSSNALYIAEKVGLAPEVVSRARESLSTRDTVTQDVMSQIESSRRAAADAERDAEDLRKSAEEFRDEYERRVTEIEEVRNSVRQKAEEEARMILRRAQDKTENILDELRVMKKGGRKGPSARKGLADIRQETLSAFRGEPEEPEEDGGEQVTFVKGDRVRVPSLGMEGILLADPEGNSARVQVGSMHATLPIASLRAIQLNAAGDVKKRDPMAQLRMQKALFTSPEINLRALRVDEAMPMLDRYLDDAYAAGLKEAKIIHGKGTGALRKFVATHLTGHPVVSTFRVGDATEGGEGATIVEFV